MKRRQRPGFRQLALTALLLCALSALPSGAGEPQEEENAQETTQEEVPQEEVAQKEAPQAELYDVYYLNREATELVRVPSVPGADNADDLLQSLMQKLNDRQIPDGTLSLFPGQVRIDAYSVADEVLELQMDETYPEMSPEREILARAGMVRTLVQVPGIQGVRFFVGDRELTGTDGEPMGIMTAEDFIDLTAGADTYRYETFTLYFTDQEGTGLTAENRSVYYRQSLPRVRVILEQLVKGPMEQEHYPTIPENTTINRITLYQDVCHVDLGAAFIDYPLDIPASTAIRSLVRTLIDNGCAAQVQISVDGDEFRTMDGGEFSLYQYFS